MHAHATNEFDAITWVILVRCSSYYAYLKGHNSQLNLAVLFAGSFCMPISDFWHCLNMVDACEYACLSLCVCAMCICVQKSACIVHQTTLLRVCIYANYLRIIITDNNNRLELFHLPFWVFEQSTPPPRPLPSPLPGVKQKHCTASSNCSMFLNRE